jgi:hypothetical protein
MARTIALAGHHGTPIPCCRLRRLNHLNLAAATLVRIGSAQKHVSVSSDCDDNDRLKPKVRAFDTAIGFA